MPSQNSKTSSSLGAFFVKDKVKALISGRAADDNHSISSRSMSSFSVADRSFAERSKSEGKVKKLDRGSGHSKSSHSRLSRSGKADLERQSGHSKSTKSSGGEDKLHRSMHAIDEDSIADFATDDFTADSPRRFAPHSGSLGNFFARETVQEPVQENLLESADNKSVVSGISIGQMSLAERSKSENRLKEKKSKTSQALPGCSELNIQRFSKSGKIDMYANNDQDDEKSLELNDAFSMEKKLRFKEGHSVFEIPRLNDSMYDDCFYTDDELADFRYAAFLEEAGLDLEEYM
jgi:hypothetical protein